VGALLFSTRIFLAGILRNERISKMNSRDQIINFLLAQDDQKSALIANLQQQLQAYQKAATPAPKTQPAPQPAQTE
jgi:hypothetical protein